MTDPTPYQEPCDDLVARLLRERYGEPRTLPFGPQRRPLGNRAAGKLRALQADRVNGSQSLELRKYVMTLRNRGVVNADIDAVLGAGRARELLSDWKRLQGWDRRRQTVRRSPRPRLIEEERRALR